MPNIILAITILHNKKNHNNLTPFKMKNMISNHLSILT